MSVRLAIPPGYSPPLAVVSDNDHTAWIVISAALGLAWTLLFAAIRVFVRWTATQGFGLDDVFLGLATVRNVTLVQVLKADTRLDSRSYSISPCVVHDPSWLWKIHRTLVTGFHNNSAKGTGH